MVKSKGLWVKLEDAEKARKILKENNMLKELKAKKSRSGVIFPIKEQYFNLKGVSSEQVDEDFEAFPVKGDFEKTLKTFGVTISSYDVVGDIAILEIPKGFEKQEKTIGEALLNSKKNLKSVFKKSSAVESPERVRGYTLIAGENRSETIYREHGCELKLDITEVFFSPRLSFERQRVIEQVKDGEIIVDMFAGVGPYSIIIAKNRDVKVVGYDINPAAIKYFEENIRINKVGHRVRAVLGDCRKIEREIKADRVIMNLPMSSKKFINSALDQLSSLGGVIHYYGVSPRNALYEEEINFIKEKIRERGLGCEITNKRIVRSYSPGEVHVAIDVRVYNEA